MEYKILNNNQIKKCEFILDNPYTKLSDLYSSEKKALRVAWCYYSGKIEGNTYTLVDTEILLIDGISQTKSYEDAKMLKNLSNIFASEMEYILKGNKEHIDEKTLFRIHKSISNDLVSSEESGIIRERAVRIGGTAYIPPRSSIEIGQKLNEILFNQDKYTNPIEKSIFLHCNLARLQPFIDGNKRTARMVESVILMNANIIPIYSTKGSDIVNYKSAIIQFYEKEDYSLYADYILDNQIDRINSIAPIEHKWINTELI